MIMEGNLRSKITPLNCIYAAFIAIEAGIFVAFNIIVAVQPNDPVYLKYSGVLLCLVTAAAFVCFYKKDAVILTCALAFTALSDYFILVIDAYYEIGVTTFFIAQAFYLYRLYADRLNRAFITLIARAVLVAAVIIILATTATLNYLLIIVAFYFVMLCVNCADAFIICGGGVKNALFAAGLLLFICCDICVGLHNFGSALGIALPEKLLTFVQYAIWIFYLPSQVLIICSASNGGLKLPCKKASGAAKEGINEGG